MFREGASLVNYKDHLYLYGGIGNQIFNDVHIYDINSNKWNKLHTTGENIPRGRFSHQGLLYKN